MNDAAHHILLQLESRKKLLLSLRTTGFWVGYDPDAHLCHGRVDKTFALVPVEHADAIPQEAVGAMRTRGLIQYIRGANIVPMSTVVADELLSIETEMAWVTECGGAR